MKQKIQIAENKVVRRILKLCLRPYIGKTDVVLSSIVIYMTELLNHVEIVVFTNSKIVQVRDIFCQNSIRFMKEMQGAL